MIFYSVKKGSAFGVPCSAYISHYPGNQTPNPKRRTPNAERRTPNVFLFVLTLLLTLTGNAYAQDEPRHTFVLTGVPLSDALALLIDKTEIELFYESEMVVGKLAFCSIEEEPVEEVLRCVLRGTELDYYRLSSGMYVVVDRPRAEAKFGALAGIVMDGETGEPLPDATIMLAYADVGTASNVAGRFSVSRLEPGLHPVVITHVAYQDVYDSLWVAPGEEVVLEVEMKPRIFLSSPVVVNGLYDRVPSEELVSQKITAESVILNPSPTPSTQDVLNEVVGVRVGDALADVHLQGGDSGEHQYLLDGVPVFVPIRNGGFFGAFSPFAFSQVTVHKAGFEASKGSFLAGAIDIQHNVASDAETLIDVQADPLSVNGRLQGSFAPLRQVNVSWMSAGRIGLWDLFQPGPIKEQFQTWSIPNTFVHNSLVPGGNTDAADASFPLNAQFYDLHAAARIRIGGTRSIYASMYRGRNAFGTDNSAESRAQDYVWSNQMRQIRYEWVQGHRTFLHLGVWSSKYRLTHPLDRLPFNGNPSDEDEDEEEEEEEEEGIEDFNEISEYGFRAGFDMGVGTRHTLSSRVEPVFTESEFALSIDPSGEAGFVDHRVIRPVRFRIQSFLEDAVALSDRTRLTIGARFTLFPSQERLYAEPRAHIRHDIPDGPGGRWALFGAAGYYRQFMYQFDVADYNQTTLLPGFRFWIPIGQDTRASSAYHVAGSVLYIPATPWQFQLEGYYKYQPHQAVLDYVNRNGIRGAQGYAYGSGMSVQYESPAVRVRGQYEYSVTRRKIEDRFDGAFVPVPWEAPHQLLLSADLTIAKNLIATARWQGVFDRSWGYRQAYYDFLEPVSGLSTVDGYDFSDPGNDTLPALSQWDAGLSYSHRLGRLRLQARINVINVFDRKNVVDWILEEDLEVLRRIDRRATPFYTSASIRVTY